MHHRMKREQETVRQMIGLYCREKHQLPGDVLCSECQELHDYAMLRLNKCPFQEGKTTCGNCKIHCYKPMLRDKICEVMRFAGPKMIFHHPVLALGHLLDGFRKEAVLPKKK